LPPEVVSKPNTVVVVLNGPAEVAAQLRQRVPQQATLVLWTQLAHDQAPMHALLDRACAGRWHRIVCISDWHRLIFQRCFQLPEGQLEVLRNAISPAFERMFSHAAELAEAKSGTPRLAYTSTPFRGLDELVSCFPQIRARCADCQLDVFSSLQVYRSVHAQDEHQGLYERCRTTAGIEYRGSVSQRKLAEELRGVRVLAYPSTFAETSCIAVMEALAAGALVVTTDLGALPETGADWARFVPRISKTHPRDEFEKDYAEAVATALDEMQADWPAAMNERYRQVEAFNAACTWRARAAEWEAAAARWLHTAQIAGT
jgi:glycosyltransferase involved in cell wall biosynthesis